MLTDLLRQLGPLERDTSPFSTPVPHRYARGAHWAGPRLAGEVAFTEWTADGSIRHPSWRGLRADKNPGAVHREALTSRLPVTRAAAFCDRGVLNHLAQSGSGASLRDPFGTLDP